MEIKLVSNIHRYLQDQFYVGKVTWNNQIKAGSHQPIVSQEVFDTVQSLLKRDGLPRYRKHRYLFKGLIQCAECGGLITWEQQKSHIYGRCHGYRNCQQSTYYKEPKINDKVKAKLETLKLHNKPLAQWLVEAIEEYNQNDTQVFQTAYNQLQDKLSQYQKRLSQLYDDRADNKIPESLYQAKLSEYTQVIDKTETQLEKLNRQDAKKQKQNKVDLFKLSQKASFIYQLAEPDEKRQLIPFIFADLKLGDGQLYHQFSEAFLKLYQSIEVLNRSKVEDFTQIRKTAFELQKYSDLQGQKEIIDSLCPIERGVWDSNPRPPA